MNRHMSRRNRASARTFTRYRFDAVQTVATLFNSKIITGFVITAVLSVSGFFIWQHTQEAEATPYVYTEDFYTNTFEDAGNTTGEWDVFTGRAEMAKTQFTNIARNSETPDLVSFGGVENMQLTGQRSDTANKMMAVSSTGVPYISFIDRDSANQDLYITKWTEGVGPGVCSISNSNDCWTNLEETAEGPSFVTDEVGEVFLYLDSNDRPVIFLEKNGKSVTRWNGTQWTYMDEVTPGVESIMPIATGGNLKVTFDSANNPYVISISSGATPQVYFIKWNGSSWTRMDGVTPGAELISVTGGLNTNADLFVDAAGVPYISWYKFLGGNSNIYFSKWTIGAGPAVCGGPSDCWTNMGGTVAGEELLVNEDGQTQIVVSSTGIPTVGWSNAGGLELIQWKWNGSAWAWVKLGRQAPSVFTEVTQENTPYFILRIGANDQPYVVWDETVSGRKQLFLSRWNGSNFVSMDGSSSRDQISNATSSDGVNLYLNDAYTFELNDFNQPRITWVQNNGLGDNDLYYTQWSGSQWTGSDSAQSGIVTLVNNSEIVGYPVLDFDGEGYPYIAWQSGTGGLNSVYFLSGKPAYLGSDSFASLEVDTTTDVIQKAVVYADLDEPVGASVDGIEVSANNGGSWCVVTLGTEVDFSTCSGDVRGNQLKWRATLSTTNPDETPAIEKLAIHYFTKSITVTNPIGGEKFNQNAVETLTWTSAYPETDPIVNVDLYYADNAACSVNVQTIATNEINDGHYEWDLGASGITAGNYYLCIRENGEPTTQGVSGQFSVTSSLLGTFDFSLDTDYTISNPVEAEIAGGVAQFVAVPGVAQQQNTQINFAGNDRAKYAVNDFAKGIEIHNTGALKLAGFGENYLYSGEGKMLVSSDAGIECLNTSDLTSCGTFAAGQITWSPSIDSEGKIWYVQATGTVGLYCIDSSLGNQPCQGINFDSNGRFTLPSSFYSLQIDAFDNVWVQGSLGVNCFDATNNYNACSIPFVAKNANLTYFESFAFDQDNRLWMVGSNYTNPNSTPTLECRDGNNSFNPCVGVNFTDEIITVDTPDQDSADYVEVDIFGNIWFAYRPSTGGDYFGCLNASDDYNECPNSPYYASAGGDAKYPIADQRGRVYLTGGFYPKCIDVLNGFVECDPPPSFASTSIAQNATLDSKGFLYTSCTGYPPECDYGVAKLNSNGDLIELINPTSVVSMGSGIDFSKVSASYPSNEYQWVTTSRYNNVSVKNWASIDGTDVRALESTPWGATTDIRYFVSFDNRATWSYWDGGAWQTIAGDPTDADFTTFGMDTATLEGLTTGNWSSVGGFQAGVTEYLDLAVGLYTNHAGVSPVVDYIGFNFTPAYTVDIPTVTNNTGINFVDLVSFSAQTGQEHSGTVEFQISHNGTDWYYHNGAAWTLSGSATPYQDGQTNTDDEVNQYITSFVGDVANGDFYFKAFMVNNDNVGSEFVQLAGVNVGYTMTLVNGAIITDSSYVKVASIDIGDDLYFQLTETSLNTNAGVAETVEAVITSTTGDSETITLTETGANTSIFRFGPLPTAGTAGANDDGTLQVSGGDTIDFVAGTPNQYYEKNIPIMNAKGLSFLRTFASPVNFGADDLFFDLYVDAKANIDTAAGAVFNNTVCDAALGGSLTTSPGGMIVITNLEIGDICTINMADPATKAWGYFLSGEIPNLVDGSFTTLTFAQGAATDLVGNGVDWSSVKQIFIGLPTNGTSLVARIDNLKAGNAPGVILDDFESYADSAGMFAAGYSEYDEVTRDQDTPTLQAAALLNDTATVNAAAPSGGGGSQPAPMAGVHAKEVRATETSLTYVFIDLANNLVGRTYSFYVNDTDMTGSVAFSQDGNEGQFTETGLQPNTAYINREVSAKEGVNESDRVSFGGETAPNYTLANVPGAPIVSVLDEISVKLTIDLNGNPEYTEFWIHETTTNRYVLVNGQLGSITQADFEEYSVWGGSNGIVITGLTEGQNYSFRVQARNGDGQLTAWSPETTITAGESNLSALAGAIYVGINIDTGAVRGVMTTAGGIIDAVREFFFPQNGVHDDGVLGIIKNAQVLFTLLLIALGAVFVATLATIFRSVGKCAELGSALRLVPTILRREASEFFGEFAQKAPNGVYEYSFAQHKRLHKLTRASLFSTVGVVGVKIALIAGVAILGTGIYGTRAQINLGLYNGAGQEVQRGDVLSYVVAFENTGDFAAQNATVTAPLDAKLTYVTGSGEIGGTLIGGESIVLSNGNLIFSIGTVQPGASGYVKFVTQVRNDAPFGQFVEQGASLNATNQPVYGVASVSNLIVQETVRPVLITSPLTTTDTTPTITGTGEPGATITLTLNGTIVGITTVDENGNWGITITNPLSAGSYTIEATDSLDQTSGPQTLTIEQEVVEEPVEPTTPTEPTEPSEPTTPTEPTEPSEPTTPTEPTEPSEPTTPTEPTEPSEGGESYQEVQVTSPLTTDSSNPPIFGTGEAGTTVWIAINGQFIGTTVVDNNGNWSIVPTTVIEPGTYTLVVRDETTGAQRQYTLTVTGEEIIPLPEVPATTDERGLLERLDDWVDGWVPFLELNEVEKTTEQIIVPSLAALSFGFTIPALAAGAFNLLPYLHLLFIEPFLVLFGRRRNKYGVVYNSLTKVPVDLAVVRLYNAVTKKLERTKITDKEGRFYMLAQQGEYYLSITKPGFIYPTQYLKDDKQDSKFADLYHGEKITVDADGTPLTMNIPLDPRERAVQSQKKEVREYLLTKARHIVSVSGIVLTAIALIVYPTAMIAGFLVLHVIMYFAFKRVALKRKAPKSWGVVYDEETKKPMQHAVVRIFDTRFNKLLETFVTDGSGRYSFLVGPNAYQVVASKEGYRDYRMADVNFVEQEGGQIAKDITLQRKTDKDYADALHVDTAQEPAPQRPHKELTADKQDDLSKIDLGNL